MEAIVGVSCGRMPASPRLEDACGGAPLSLEERAQSALAAREYGGSPAADGVLAELRAERSAATRAFDAAHATDFVACHDAFAHGFRTAYGKPYTRTLHADWTALRLLVGEHGGAFALILIDRAFSEPLLVRAGIDSPVVVLNWAGTLGAPRAPGVRSYLSAAQRRLCEAVIAERAGASA